MNRVADRTPVTSSQRVSELVEVPRFEAAIAPYNKRTHATCETHAHDAQRWADETEKRMCQFVGFVGEKAAVAECVRQAHALHKLAIEWLHTHKPELLK